MIDCDKLLHPFQNDPGISQRQRIMEDLLAGSANIDGRTLADLLNYFVQLSRHINYYNQQLNVSDWQPFFKKSIPFSLASIIKFNEIKIRKKFESNNNLFNRHPSRQALQLLLHSIYYNLISRIDNWHLQVKGSSLPFEIILEKIIKDKLRDAVLNFIAVTNAAVSNFGIKRIDFLKLHDNKVWNLEITDLYIIYNVTITTLPATKRELLIAFRDEAMKVVPAFTKVINTITGAAEMSMQQSLIPLKQEMQKKHTPHLGLLFAFLKLFQYLQNDLNSFTKKHLDFFYKEVLKLKPRDATPDKAHVIFEIQNQLDKYLLKQGLLLKDGKDKNKADVLFSLDNEIVVNKTQVAEVKTLFLNNQIVHDNTYVEGVYMAPDAYKADGVKIDFKDGDSKNWPTLGARLSKYVNQEKKFIQPFPNARIGFILASPVLLLNEGKRMVTISLACELKNDYCLELNALPDVASKNNCCEENEKLLTETRVNKGKQEKSQIPFLQANKLYNLVNKILSLKFYYVNEILVQQAIKKGIGAEVINKLYDLLTGEEKKLCYCPVNERKFEKIVNYDFFQSRFLPTELDTLSELFKAQQVFRILFSGEKEWVEPSVITSIILNPTNASTRFNLNIGVELNTDKPAVTFFNKENLKEDYDTILPLVKIELNDHIKLALEDESLFRSSEVNVVNNCCLDVEGLQPPYHISLYHFFRNVILSEDATHKTNIKVEVCGVKNFIVQNDENIQDVNNLINPFGVRPKVGASFYIGSKEIFFKDWTELRINVEWKDRPVSFEDHYVNYNYGVYEDGTSKITDASFIVGSAILAKGEWKTNGSQRLFKMLAPLPPSPPVPTPYPISNDNFCNHQNLSFNQEVYQYLKLGFSNYSYEQKELSSIPLVPLNVNSTYGFLRLTLQGVSFQHDRFAFVLARHMMALAKLADPISINAAVIHLVTVENLANAIKSRNISIISTIAVIKGRIASIELGFLQIETEINNIKSKVSSIKNEVTQIKSLINEIQLLIGQIVSQIDGIETKVGEMSVALTAANNGLSIIDGSTPLPDILLAIPAALTFITQAFNKIGPIVTSITAIGSLIAQINSKIGSLAIVDTLISDVEKINTEIQIIKNNIEALETNAGTIKTNTQTIKTQVEQIEFLANNDPDGNPNIPDLAVGGISELIQTLLNRVNDIKGLLQVNVVLQNGLPQEPYTPTIKSISIDYRATANIKDIDLIHLYPYEGTYKHEEIEQHPTLLPVFCDEGTLFVGLSGLQPGSIQNILFQLAEATSDSESEREEIQWHYLDNNQWKLLRTGFEVLEDDTDGLTTSGIIRFALPANMTMDNTILPKGLHWIKVSIRSNSRSVAETFGIHTQAMRVSFTNSKANDTLRLAEPLASNAISKLNEADAAVKKVNQPYESFGGRVPEEEGQFYVRISELLRHKGKAIQKFDYERLVLEAFPQIYKVKCINHSYALNAHKFKNDFPVAPGYIIIAVIPDLNKLKAGELFEPKAPLSLLGKIEDYLHKRTSPFVRLKAMNPRYEKINFCLKVKLYLGKDENYYKEKLKEDLQRILAPWAIGEFDKIPFGQCVYRSDIVRFLESRDYLDYIIELKMRPESAVEWPDDPTEPVCPFTPRSILIAGDIDVCVQQNDCEEWDSSRVCNQKREYVVNYCKEPNENK